MTNLEDVSGLPMLIEDDYKLKFKTPLKAVTPTARTMQEMKPVLMDPNATSDRNEMYYMYRNVHFPDHEATLKKIGLTYDITVIPPTTIGKEFNKTVGHYHANQAGSMMAYPEIYEVLYGKATFLLQKMDPEFKNLIRVLTLEAEAGQKVIYPPNYGHILINTTDDVLVLGNWVANDFKRMYDEVANLKGMAYYGIKNDLGELEFVPNPAYRNHPQVETLTRKFMTDTNFAIMKPGPMYLLGMNNPSTLEFLTDPQKYAVELSSVTS